MYCVVKLKHTNWCSVNLLSLIISSHLISYFTLHSLMWCSTLEENTIRSFDRRWSSKNNDSSVKNLIIKIFNSNVLLSCHTTTWFEAVCIKMDSWMPALAITINRLLWTALIPFSWCKKTAVFHPRPYSEVPMWRNQYQTQLQTRWWCSFNMPLFFNSVLAQSSPIVSWILCLAV